MSIIQSVFKFKKPVADKLIGYGFAKEGENFVYRTFMCDNCMRLTVVVDACGDIKTEVWDIETEEPYTLFLVEGAAGEFIGKVRGEYSRVLEDIAEKCFEKQIFKGAHTASLIEYAREKYGDELEFLWEDTPDGAILRRKDTKKWYALIMVIGYKKLGVDCDGTVEIVDLRMEPEELDKTVDNKAYFRGWHMNKKHWVTMLLDGTSPFEEIVRRLDKSYVLAVK